MSDLIGLRVASPDVTVDMVVSPDGRSQHAVAGMLLIFALDQTL
jgi:hypothetical protein